VTETALNAYEVRVTRGPSATADSMGTLFIVGGIVDSDAPRSISLKRLIIKKTGPGRTNKEVSDVFNTCVPSLCTQHV
jgi:hypothetical protein